jgi:hypothetical protein
VDQHERYIIDLEEKWRLDDLKRLGANGSGGDAPPSWKWLRRWRMIHGGGWSFRGGIRRPAALRK